MRPSVGAFPVVLSFAAAAVAQDRVRTVDPGREQVQQELPTPGLTDVWKLDVEQDEMLWCSVDSGAFDPSGDRGFVAESGGLGGDVLVAYRASMTGRHTLVVQARSGAGDGVIKAVQP